MNYFSQYTCTSISASCKEYEVQRGKSISLHCDAGHVARENIGVVRWQFVPMGITVERAILEWTTSSLNFLIPNPDRYKFDNQTFLLEILFTNFADNGNYICRLMSVQVNETEAKLFEDIHHLTVYGMLVN